MENIYVDGVGRSGTTFTLQVIKNIIKIANQQGKNFNVVNGGHSFSIKKSKYHSFIIIRNLKDVLISRWRIELSIDGKYNEHLERKMNLEEIKSNLNLPFENSSNYPHMGVMIKQINSLINFCQNSLIPISFIPYEKSSSDLNYLIDLVTSKLNISLTDVEKNKILSECSLESNKKISNLYSQAGFNHYDSKTMIHGHHIFKGETNTWKNYIPELYYSLVETTLSSYEDQIIEYFPDYKK